MTDDCCLHNRVRVYEASSTSLSKSVEFPLGKMYDFFKPNRALENYPI